MLQQTTTQANFLTVWEKFAGNKLQVLQIVNQGISLILHFSQFPISLPYCTLNIILSVILEVQYLKYFLVNDVSYLKCKYMFVCLVLSLFPFISGTLS